MSGSRMRQKRVHAPAPSIAAASSRSFGTVAAKLRSIQIVTGSAKAGVDDDQADEAVEQVELAGSR